MSTSRLLTPLIAAALLMTGCAVAPPGGTTGTTDGTMLAEKDSPLVKYLSFLFNPGNSPDSSPAEQQAYRNEQEQRRQKVVAQCMTEQGFEYTPFVEGGGTVATGDSDENPWRPDDRDWVEKYGYGATQNPYQDIPEPEPNQQVDPNQAYVESLTEAEQTAYYDALNGKPREVAEGGSDDDAPAWKWEEAGCFGRAYHEIEGKDPWQQEENKPIMAAIQKFFDGVQSGPEFAKLDADWAACMTDAGRPGFAKQPDAQDSIYQLTDQYWKDRSPKDDGSEQDDTLGTMKDPEWAELADQEIPLALADLECREKTDYRQAQLRIRFAAEEEFITDHKAELDAFRKRVEQGA
ncbi:MAG: hypothetical protein QM804_06455 [Propionicimonas sp.]